MVIGHHGHHGLFVNKKQEKNVNVEHEPVHTHHLNSMGNSVKEIHLKSLVVKVRIHWIVGLNYECG